MARLTGNTVVTRPDTLDVVALAEGDDVPGWADGLIGEHLLLAEEAGSGAPDESWTVVELREYAKANDVDLDGATAKADILAAINEA